MAIPNPNPNIADGIKSDNKTYSSNKIESLIKTATELPIPVEGDTGKVLTVNSELGYDLESIPTDENMLYVTTVSYDDLSVSVSAGGYKDVFYNKDISEDLPEGAKIQAIIACSTSPMSVLCTQVVNSNTNASIAVFNPGASAITITTVTFKVIYKL